MDDYESLSHSKWECKYHVVFIPKCRRRTLYVELRRHLGEVFRRLAEQKESRIEEGHLLADHVHMLISIPPKYAVSQVIGSIKGKSAIALSPSKAAIAAANFHCVQGIGGRREARLR
jgi:putative transposase